jgi:dolichyl-diphosphooligosaccharide--protein glycosyltransferase
MTGQVGLLLAFLTGVAFLVRVGFGYETVLGGSFVRFAENDPWYHMRLIEHLIDHFPFRLTYDPYLLAGSGQNVHLAPGFDLLVAAVALVLGAGAPSPSLTEYVGALLPPVLGALCVLPVYGLGRTLFSTRAGLLAAGLAAILPGQFLRRSAIGFTDHHVAEILLSACAALFFVRAIERCGTSKTAGLRDRILAGFFLGAYLICWTGGAVMVVVLTIAAVGAIAIARMREQPIVPIVVSTTIAFVVAAVMAVPFRSAFEFARSHLAVLAIGWFACLAVAVLASAIRTAGRARLVIVPITVVALWAGTTLASMLAPGWNALIETQVRRLAPSAASLVSEATPLLAAPVAFPMLVFLELGATVLLAVPASLWLVRRASGGRIVLLTMFVSGAVMMAGQIRFSYYLGVPVAVLAGYASDRILARAGRRQETVFLLLILLVFVPNAQFARMYASAQTGPSNDWHAALTWLRANSPEPFASANAYDDDYSGFHEGNRYPVPESFYSVTSWWDRGYWIIRLARRPVSANPTQVGARRVAEVLVAGDEATGAAALARLRSRYVIVDDAMRSRLMPGRTEAGGAMDSAIRSSGRDPAQYYDVFYQKSPDGALQPLLLYYPAYYQMLGVRLHALGGQATQPRRVSVVLFRDEPDATRSRKIIERIVTFTTHDAAVEFVRSAPSPARIVSADPFESCVRLPALRTLRLIHQANGVAIFEFGLPADHSPPRIRQ